VNKPIREWSAPSLSRIPIAGKNTKMSTGQRGPMPATCKPGIPISAKQETATVFGSNDDLNRKLYPQNLTRSAGTLH
jgi:hypothetical protein